MIVLQHDLCACIRVCVCVCLCVFLCVCLYVCVWCGVCVCVCMCVCVCVCLCVFMCVCLCVCVFVYVCVCVCVCLRGLTVANKPTVPYRHCEAPIPTVILTRLVAVCDSCHTSHNTLPTRSNALHNDWPTVNIRHWNSLCLPAAAMYLQQRVTKAFPGAVHNCTYSHSCQTPYWTLSMNFNLRKWPTRCNCVV